MIESNSDSNKRLLNGDSGDDVEPSTSQPTKKVKTKPRGKWEIFSNNTIYIYTSNGCEGRFKIAAYDMDKTLIKTKSGRKFPANTNDWQLLYESVPATLKKYHDDGYKIVILSNQGSLGSGVVKVRDFKKKIEGIVEAIGVPMQVFLAAGESIYRKPRTGMWDFLANHKNDGIIVDKAKSFYVGDAAGRKGIQPRKRDHSLADRLLALNLNLTFYTPEEHFLGQDQEPYVPPLFNPKDIIGRNSILCDPPGSQLTSDKQEIIVMVGSPGSGKSHFAKTHLPNYYYINKDLLRNWEKCISRTRNALSEGKSVVIDNTNADKTSRQKFLDLAKKFKVPARCFVMNIEPEQIKHNIIFRILTDPNYEMTNDIMMDISVKKLLPPTADEGFTEIVKINFVPSFKSEEDRRLYEMYLLG